MAAALVVVVERAGGLVAVVVVAAGHGLAAIVHAVAVAVVTRGRLVAVVDAVAVASCRWSRSSTPSRSRSMTGAKRSRSFSSIELVVGHALLVQAGTLLVQLRLRALGLGLALRDPGPLLGLGRLALACSGLGALLFGGAFATLMELALALLELRLAAHARQA